MTTRLLRAFFVVLVAAAGAAAQTADLSVTQSPGGDVLTYDGTISVAIVAASAGPLASNISVTYNATGGYPTGGSGSGWTCQTASGSQITCTYRNLGAGGRTPTLTVRAKATAVGTQKYTSRADVVSTSGVPDPDTSNNAAQSTHDVKYATTTYIQGLLPGRRALVGAEVTIMATLSNPSGVRVYPANLIFRAGPNVIGTAPVTTGGHATLVTSSLPVGVHTLLVQFEGSGNFLPSEAQDRVAIVDPTTTTLTASVNPSAYGTAVQYTATVSSPRGTPTGAVAFYLKGGAFPYARVSLNNGVAIINLFASMGPGTYELTAVYSGSASHMESQSSPVTHQITQSDVAVTLRSSGPQTTYGEPTTLAATVASNAAGTSIPSGRVSFKRDGVLVGASTVIDGVATLTPSPAAFPAGTSQLTAHYSGNALYYPAESTAVAQTVAKANTATTLASSLNPAVYGQRITFTANVTSPTSPPVSGPVHFYRNNVLVATVAAASGVAAYSTSAWPAGTYAIHAVYAGSADVNGSTSEGISQAVNRSVTSTTLSSTPNPSLRAQGVTFTASVTATSGGVPRGGVTFKSGTTALRTVSLSSGAASLTLSTLPVGTHSVTATYLGNPNMEPSVSSAVSQSVLRRLDATITAPHTLCAGATASIATVTAQSGVTYTWSVEGGTITGGAGTNRITFTAGSSGYVTLSANLSCEGCASASDTHSVTIGSALGVLHRDLSGDGLNDLVWQDRSTGATRVWAMNGTTPSAVVGISSPGAGWSAETAADMNRDGKPDLVYRNTQTAAAMLWLMNGLSNIGSMTLPAPQDLAWKLGGIADFNCDGDADVVWNNPATRASAVWLMNGGQVSSVVPLPAMTSGWTVRAVGDFNSDGRADVVWRRTSDGRNAVWLMNGLTVTSTVFIQSQPDLNWSLDAVADYSRDGRPDLVWRNATTGANQIWVMDGTTVSSIVPLNTVSDPNTGIGGPR